MKIQSITNKQGVTMTLIITKAPSRIVNKAQRLILRLREHEVGRGMRPKVIQRDRRWLSYRINRNYAYWLSAHVAIVALTTVSAMRSLIIGRNIKSCPIGLMQASLRRVRYCFLCSITF